MTGPISIRGCKRIIRELDKDIFISLKAQEKLVEVLLLRGKKIARKAIGISRNSKRNTVYDKDIELAEETL